TSHRVRQPLLPARYAQFRNHPGCALRQQILEECFRCWYCYDAEPYTSCASPRMSTAPAPAAAKAVASERAIGVEIRALTRSPSQAPTNNIAMARAHSHSGVPVKSTPPRSTSLSRKETVLATTSTGCNVATNSR